MKNKESKNKAVLRVLHYKLYNKFFSVILIISVY